MSAVILGRKVGMTTRYGVDGHQTPITVIAAGPCRVISQRTKEKEGYVASVVGFEEIEGAKLNNKSLLGLFKKAGTSVYKTLMEFRDFTGDVGAELKVDQFKEGDILSVTGTSKGHGWTGVIKKWNFATGRESHGGNCQRKMGSSGMHTWPARVIKGKKMSGRWGTERVTLRSVEVIQVIPEENLLLIKGPIPGSPRALLKIFKLGEKKKAGAPKAKAA